MNTTPEKRNGRKRKKMRKRIAVVAVLVIVAAVGAFGLSRMRRENTVTYQEYGQRHSSRHRHHHKDRERRIPCACHRRRVLCRRNRLLYRDEVFSTEQRIGVGTVVMNDTEVYEDCGTITRLHVSEGEYVERGELLYELAGSDRMEITVQTSGILTERNAVQGDRVEQGQSIAAIVPKDQICIEIQVNETDAAHIRKGDAVCLTFADDPDEEPVPGSVIDISWIAKENQYSVRIIPLDERDLRIGMTVSIQMAE